MFRRSILTYVLLIIVGNALGFLGCQLRLRLHRTFADCVTVPKGVRMTESATAVDAPSSTPVPIPIGTTYCTCSNCKTAYLLDGKALNFRGNKVRCEVCNKEWFQTTDRLFRTDETNELLPMPKETVEDVKRILAEGNALRYSRVDKVGVFVGNLPYSYAEKEIEELLAEYGVINVSLVRDADQQSKGFAFVDISSKEDAERLLSEMANYYTEPGRKLTVRMSTSGPINARSRPPRNRQDGNRGSANVPGDDGLERKRMDGDSTAGSNRTIRDQSRDQNSGFSSNAPAAKSWRRAETPAP